MSPEFASTTEMYSATVNVSRITVTPTKSAGNATVVYLDGNDAVIADADSTTAGHQIDLSVGVNTVKVKVTAEDTVTTKTYTLSLPLSLPSLTIADANATEGSDVSFTVTLSVASEDTVGVTWTASARGVSDTADTGDLAGPLTGTLTFSPGDISKTFTVSTAEDTTDEADETFTVTLSGPTNATLGDATGTGTIADDDGAPSLSVADAAAAEGSDVSFTVTLSPASGKTVTVRYDTSRPGGTTAEAADFTAQTNRTLTIPAGATTGTIAVPTANDTIDEDDETFRLTLSSPTNATLADATATATITDDDDATLSVNDVSGSEGGTLTFTVTLSVASEDTVGVTWTASAGGVSDTADTGDLAGPLTGTLTFSPGDTSKTFTVSTAEDTTDEADETFTVTLSGPTNATLGDATGTGTIADDDGAPSLSVADAAAAEGSDVSFTVTLSAASGKTVTVLYDTSRPCGTTAEAADFTAQTNRTLTIPAGATTGTIAVPTANDTIDEDDETFRLTLSSPTNATLADATATGTITDDDDATLSVNDVSGSEGGTLTFTVTLSVASEDTVGVTWTASAGGVSDTADTGDLAGPLTGTLTFSPGDISKTFTVSTAEDTTDEADETFTVTLSGPTNATLGDATGTGTIADDDGAPSLSVADAAAAEGSDVSFTVTLSAASGKTVTVLYDTSRPGGTTAEAADFTAQTNRTLTIPAGATTGTIAVPTANDTIDEDDETFRLTLSSPTNATLADATATGTITDDDDATLSVNDVSGSEGGTLTFTVTLSVASEDTVGVTWTASAGGVSDTADTGDLAGPLTGTLTFSPGDISKTFTVSTAEDTTDEADETFTVTLSGPTNATLGDATGTGTIADDDGAPSLSVADAAAAEGSDVSFTVTLSPASGKTVTVRYDTSRPGGTTAEAADFTAQTNRTLTIPAGATTGTIAVPTANDTIDEDDETFRLTLSSPTNATLADATATATITDDDDATLSVNDVSGSEGGTLTFTVTLSVASEDTVGVTWTASAGGVSDTADTGDLAGPLTGTLTFSPGDTSKTFTVSTAEDTTDEADETFTVTLSGPTNATLGDATGTGTIADSGTLSVTEVTVSSTPAAGETYLGGEAIEFTVAFTAPVTVTGTPKFAFMLGAGTRQAAFAGSSGGGSGTAELVFSYPVQAGEKDTDGISWAANALALDGGTVRLTTTDPSVEEDADLKHSAQREGLAGHRVDAVPPGVESASMRGTTLWLVYDEPLDGNSRPAGTAYTLTADSVTSHPVSVAIAGSTVTLTYASAPAEGATVTLAYTAPASNPVKDAAGNPAPGFSGRTVVRGPVVIRIDVGPTPTPNLAKRYGYSLAQLSSNVLGLRRCNLYGIKAHGEGARLTFEVVFDRDVTVMGTGEPMLKLDLWGETRTATLVPGSPTTGTGTLSFTWRPVLTGDNDFDGIEVREKGLQLPGGTYIVDAGNVESKFVPSSFRGERLDEDKVFGGFHEMWIKVDPEAEAVEDETYTFSVKRNGERSRDPDEESHYVLVGITDSAFPEVPALGHYDEGENGPGGRAVTFKYGEDEGRRARNKENPVSVTPPPRETTGGRTMTIALHATHFTVQNERGELAHRIYMPRNLDGVTVPVRPIGTARAGAAPAIVGTPAVSAPQRNGAYAAEERIEAQVAFDTAVIVDETGGSPTFAIALAGRRHDAAYVSGSGSATLRFALEAPAGAEGTAAARAIANGLVLNGATVRDAEGNDAVLDLGASPRIASLAIGAAPGADGTWDAGENVEVAVTFEEPVTVDTESGTPTLRARVETGTYAIPYASGTGTDTLTFAIGREDGAAPAPTVIVEGDSLALNGGAIESTAGLVADIAHPGAARAGFVAPELASIVASDAEAREGEALEFRLELSQTSETPVSVDYETADGTAQEGADYVSLSGTVSFAPGETVKTVAVATLGDGDAEPAETLTLRLSNAQGATLATPEASGTIAASAAAGALTGTFSTVPREHDGTEAFTLTLTFSDEPSGLSYKTVRDSLFTEEGGTIEGARRESPPSNQAFVVTVKPGGDEAVTLTLKPVPPCGQEKTVCTAGRAVLNGPLGVTVPGPAALSVADAQVQEGPGATLEFVVSLDRVRHAPVRVDYATANGEAVAGDDYVHAAGTLTFAPGETGHTVSVPVLADEHDEDSETLTLKLTNPVGARIADGEAVGTIHNNGAIPKAWIARFGRTVAEQVLVAVEGRMRATPAPGVEVALAGERIGGQGEPGSEAEREARREEEARREAQRFADWLRGETDPEEAQRIRSRAVTPRDLLTGSSFGLTSETAGKDLVSLWGRGAVSRFDGREGRLTLDGEVVTGMLGADWTRGRWTAGLIVSHSAGEGGYSGAPGAGDGAGNGPGAGTGPGSGSGASGRVEATLTGVFPWGRYALSDRLEAWGAAGYGQGELTVTPKKPGTDEEGAAIRAGLELPCLEGRARPDHASEPCGRREDVRRLCRRHPRGDRRPYRRGPRGPDLRRHPGRLQLHLRRGDLDASAAQLDWLSRRPQKWPASRSKARGPSARSPAAAS